MDAKTIQLIDQVLQGKKMEKEAVMGLLSGPMKGHIEVISQEVTKMMIELLQSCLDSSGHRPSGQGPQSKVKKVTIG